MSYQREIHHNATEDWLEEIEPNINTLIPTQARKKGRKINRLPQLIPRYGDIYGKKKKHTMRIYFNNINGISSDKEVQGNMEFMREIDADLWGWVETNCSWTENQKHRTGSQGRQIFNKFKVEAVASDDPTIGWKQPGGACIGINGNNVGAIVQSGKDNTGLGQWVYVCIGG